MRLSLLLSALLLCGCQALWHGAQPGDRVPGPAALPDGQDPFEVVAKDLIPQLPAGSTVGVAAPKVSYYNRTTRSLSTSERQVLARFAELPVDLLSALVRTTRSTRTRNPRLAFVTQERLAALLQEQGLLWRKVEPTDPKVQAKLKEIEAVNTYLVWRIRLGRVYVYKGWSDGWILHDLQDWNLQAINVKTGQIVGAAKAIRVYRRWDQ